MSKAMTRKAWLEYLQKAVDEFDWDAVEQEQSEPVAWMDEDGDVLSASIVDGTGLRNIPLYTKPQGWRDNVAQAYLKGFDEASAPLLKSKERLIRIMGTFDLATGHADTFDELLNSLESELKDVLGYYRQRRTWVGLTDEEIKEIIGPWGDTPIKGYTRKLFDQIEAKLRSKNT